MEMIKLPYMVFPSQQETIEVSPGDVYGGAHYYLVEMSKGFNNGITEYTGTKIAIPFVKKNDDGTMEAGIQSEQLAYVLLDRTIKLNNRFPSEQNAKMIEGLEMFIKACVDRVEDRLLRGVMGNLTK